VLPSTNSDASSAGLARSAKGAQGVVVRIAPVVLPPVAIAPVAAFISAIVCVYVSSGVRAMPTDAVEVALGVPTTVTSEKGVSTAPHARVVARAVVEPVYALCTFAAVTFVGDPILVAMLHAAFAAAAVTGAVGSRLASDVHRVARVTGSDDAMFIAQVRGLRPLKNPARLFAQLCESKLTDASRFPGGYGGLAPHQVTFSSALYLFMATQVMAAPSFGLAAVLVVSALVAAYEHFMVIGRAPPPSEPRDAAVETKRAKHVATTLVFSVSGALLCALATGKDLRRGPSLFPLTQFDGSTACAFLFLSVMSCSELRVVEAKRNEKIAALEAHRKESLAAAAEMPAAEAPQPPPAPPVAFDAFSKAVYANAFGFLVIMGLAVAFRISSPYEEAVLSGEAGAYLLLSCATASINAVVVAASEHTREGTEGERKPIFAATFTRALTIVISWHVSSQRPSAAAAVGVAFCLVALATATRHVRKT
jgi:hypothetical protein